MTDYQDNLYWSLRSVPAGGYFDERSYKTLIDYFYMPYQGTFYGKVLEMIGRELAQKEPRLTVDDCMGLPPCVLFDIYYYMDLYEEAQRWSSFF